MFPPRCIHSNPVTGGDASVRLSVHDALNESFLFNIRRGNEADWLNGKALECYSSGTWFESRPFYRVSLLKYLWSF
jgi:hypothetical protein